MVREILRRLPSAVPTAATRRFATQNIAQKKLASSPSIIFITSGVGYPTPASIIRDNFKKMKNDFGFKHGLIASGKVLNGHLFDIWEELERENIEKFVDLLADNPALVDKLLSEHGAQYGGGKSPVKDIMRVISELSLNDIITMITITGDDDLKRSDIIKTALILKGMGSCPIGNLVESVLDAGCTAKFIGATKSDIETISSNNKDIAREIINSVEKNTCFVWLGLQEAPAAILTQQKFVQRLRNGDTTNAVPAIIQMEYPMLMPKEAAEMRRFLIKGNMDDKHRICFINADEACCDIVPYIQSAITDVKKKYGVTSSPIDPPPQRTM